ncbi:MAG TPA: hypothetical protein VKV06_17230 [Acidimicrobiales bacterium]|nr:hypothetical protein [Acidimicrobiales bacterium]
MRREHYGAVILVLAGFLICRLLSFPVVDALGALGGHTRVGDTVVGVVFCAIPFLALIAYTSLQLAGVDIRHRHWVQPIAAVGWLFAGGVVGLLPYSRFGTSIRLVDKARTKAPGLLHAIDFTLIIGVLVTVGLLLLALRGQDRDLPPRR